MLRSTGRERSGTLAVGSRGRVGRPGDRLSLALVDRAREVLFKRTDFDIWAESEKRSMGGKITRLLIGIFGILPFVWAPAGAATIAEVIAKIKPLKTQERLNYLLKGAQAEGELVYYGTLPIDEFLPLARIFNARYRSLATQHYFAPRDGILSRTLTEARAGRHATDVIQVDLSYGYQLLNANLVQPYAVPGADRFFEGTYDPSGAWHSMYYLTTALMYNFNLVKADQAPKSYEDLLNPSWKGKMLFDPE